MWKWWEHDIRSSLTLFEQTQAWFGQRLHFIIPCVYYHIPIRRLAYSEKVNKILQYFDSKEL
jgi:polysaccharide pyruvyl transferase WcaK-like protein